MIAGNARIQKRLIVGFGIVLLLLIVGAAISIFEMSRVNASLNQINDINSVKQRYAINFRGSVHDRAISLRDVTLVTNQQEFNEAVATIKRLEEFYAKSAGPLDAMFEGVSVDTQDLAILKDIKAVEARTMPLVPRVIAAQSAGDLEGARRILLEEARPAFIDWLAVINRFIDFQEAKNKEIGAEVNGVVDRFGILMIAIAVVSLAIGGAFAWWNVRALRPLSTLTGVMMKLAQGDLKAQVPSIQTKDEIGDIVSAVNVFKQNALDRVKLEAEQQSLETERTERARRIEALTTGFAQELERSLGALNSSSEELMGEAGGLDQIAERAAESSKAATGSTSGASSNVNSIAAATMELSAAIQEISARMAESATAAGKASAGSKTADDTVTELSKAAQSIGGIVATISSVAAQTNLLALNATIEAARAGESGKGFAVVASEVKALANQTSQATEDISHRIQEIQAISERSVEQVRIVIGLIEQMKDISSAVAAAAEEQSATTSGIAQNVNEAASQSGEAVSSVNDLAEATERTRAASSSVQKSAQRVETLSQALKASSERFFSSLRAA